MLLMIEQPRWVSLHPTAPRKPAQMLAIGALDVSLNPALARQKAGIKAGINAGIKMGLRGAWPARGRSTRVLVVNATAKIRVRRCFIAQ